MMLDVGNIESLIAPALPFRRGRGDGRLIEARTKNSIMKRSFSLIVAAMVAMLVNAVLKHFQDKWLVSGNGMAGKGSANLIRTRRLGRHFIICGDGVSDVEASGTLFSARVMACAAHEALAVIQIIAGDFENVNIKE